MSELADHLLQLGFEPLEDAFAPIPGRDVIAIEKRLGPLPEDYKALVMRVGGAFYAGQATVAGHPLGLIYGGTTNRSLTSRLSMYEGRIPEGMIPIADGRGDQFLLLVAGPENGGVFHWDHHREPDPEDYLERDLPVPDGLMYTNVTKVGSTFSEFVQSIKIKGRPSKPRGSTPAATTKKARATKAKAAPRRHAAKKSTSRTRRSPSDSA